MTAEGGGHRIGGIGSFTEIALPDLRANEPHVVTVVYTAGYKPANRAWRPLGPYLRVGSDTIPLPMPDDDGCRAMHLPDLGPPTGLNIVPQPTLWEPATGTSGVIGINCQDPTFQTVGALAKRHGLAFEGETAVGFEVADLPRDAYHIVISPNSVTISAGDAGGRFYAAITLLNLLQHGPLPCGTITDAPRFGWRGQHLDTARHFYDPQTICDLLDLMALLKLNRFHWHFADDEAFCLELDCVPELWQKTRLCGEGHLLPALFSGQVSAGGSYSKATVQAIIDHAAALHIDVLPEIETPAHAIALTHVYPEMRDPSDNGAETSVQGYKANAVNPAMPKTWEVLTAIIEEIATLFPFDIMHLGCDELPEGTWMGSPRARQLMADEGLENTDDLQGWMMARLAQVVVDNGKRPAGWEESARGANGGIGHNALLMSWTGQGPGLDAARAGYDVVMSPAQHVYLDMAHTSDPDDWGASWAAFVSLQDTVSWDPVPDPELAARIVGVQGTFWSEFTTQDAQIWPMLLPRIFGVAAMAWQERPPTSDDITKLAYCHFATSGHFMRR